MNRKRLLARLLALLGLAGLAAYLLTLATRGPPESPPPTTVAAFTPPAAPSAPAPFHVHGDVSDELEAATSNGDVHIRTPDGVYYDLQLVGEFIALKSTADDLEIQVRQGPWQGSSKTVSTNIAVAMNVAGDRIGLYVGKNSIEVNGQQAQLPGQPVGLPKGGTIVPSGSRLSIIWPDQTTVQVAFQGNYLDLLIQLADERGGKITGLFGNFDGDPANDLTTRDGVVVTGPAAAEPDKQAFLKRLYQQFGASWRIRQAESLFTYGPGESTNSFTDLNFPYQLVASAGLDEAARQHAKDICTQAGITDSGFLDNCIFDVGVTGEAQFAQSTAQSQAAVKFPVGLECRSLPQGGDRCTNYQPSLPAARIGSQYEFTIETMAGTAKQMESFNCSLIDPSRRASCRIKTKGNVFAGGAMTARYMLDTGTLHEDKGVMERQ